MVTKPQRRKIFLSEKTKRAITEFMNSSETAEMFADPKATQALLESTARIRLIAHKRRKAREIPLALRLAPCTV